MQVRELKKADQSACDAFVFSHPLASIHQTWTWGEFQQRASGRDKFWALGVFDESNQLRGTALIIKQKLPFNLSWLYIPRGPLISFNTKVSDVLFAKIKAIAKQEKAVFLRIDPELEIPLEQIIETPLLPNFRKAHAEYQPEFTLKLDLSLTQDELLKQMKEKGRYNIRLAEKKGVKVRSTTDLTDINHFYDLLTKTTNRDHFSAHSKKYYQDLLEIFGREKMARLYLAEFAGQVIAGIIVTFYKNTATYYFGASGNEHRAVMAPYLLQWTAICDARKMGLKWYDFLGIAPENAPNHPWQGITSFKKKFGGHVVRYRQAEEFVCRPFWYAIIILVKKIKHILK